MPSPRKCGRTLKNCIPKAKPILAGDIMAYVFLGRNKMKIHQREERRKRRESDLGMSGEL